MSTAKTKHTNKKLFLLPKFWIIIALAGLLTFAGLLYGQNIIQNNDKSAKAGGNTTVNLAPGQKAFFTVTYASAGDTDLTDGQLLLYIGKELEVDTSTLKDNYENRGFFQVSPSILDTTSTSWGSRIIYGPGSANNPNGPSGNGLPVAMPASENLNKFTFEARLKSDVLSRYSVGTILTPVPDNEGILSKVVSTNASQYSSEINIKIVASAVSSSSSSIVSSSSSSSSVVSSSSSSISSVSSSSSSSIIVQSSSSSVVSSSSSSSIQTQLSYTNQLYFIGKDNKVLNWDTTTMFNTNYPDTQKWRDGNVKLVFDNIKKVDNTQIADGSACTFNLYRYTQSQVIKTYTSVTSLGKCEANLPVADQGTNYYTIVVTAKDKTTNEEIKDADRLVLYVGGIGTRSNPNIEL